VVDDLLDVSRISSVKIGLVREPVNLSKLVRDVVADFRPALERDRLNVSLEVADGDRWVHGDAVRLTQIIGNLLQNALKFTDSGGAVTIQMKHLKALNEAMLTIRDTGIGIDGEMLARLFDPFSQADRSLERTRGGLGLGLALVHGLVDLHGGTIEAASDGVGKGAQFTIRLHLIDAPVINEGRHSEKPRCNAQRFKILVIEDQPDTVHTMERLLAGMGHEVYTALNGEDGVRMAREMHPRVVFSDIGLPGMNGYDVAQAVRSDPEATATFLIAVTGYGQEADMRRALQAGFDRHLVKPIMLDDIERLLQSL